MGSVTSIDMSKPGAKVLDAYLARAARKNGGDRYEVPGRDDLAFYLPQDISRPDGGAPIQKVRITIEEA